MDPFLEMSLRKELILSHTVYDDDSQIANEYFKIPITPVRIRQKTTLKLKMFVISGNISIAVTSYGRYWHLERYRPFNVESNAIVWYSYIHTVIPLINNCYLMDWIEFKIQSVLLFPRTAKYSHQRIDSFRSKTVFWREGWKCSYLKQNLIFCRWNSVG